MRRSYASVAKDDILSSSLPASNHSGQTAVFDATVEEHEEPQKASSAEEIAAPINIQPGSILARTRNRLYQSALPTASSVISPPPTASKSCSPPTNGTRMLLHAASMQALSSGSHQTMQPLHHQQQQYVYGKPANSPPTNQIAPRQTGASYDKRIVLYKTEMCRTFEETGICRYGTKCQFAHDRNELRQVARHPRYKTEICKTYWQLGTCPYGKRCCFIHSESEVNSLATSQNSHSPLPTHNMLSNVPRAAINHSEDDLTPADEADMESMMEHLPTDMLSML